MEKGMAIVMFLIINGLQMIAGQCCKESTCKSKMNEDNVLRSSSGRPIGDKLNSFTLGPRGPMLLQDITYFEEIAHFDRERIPTRVVHAKGNGAFGYFEVTHDITEFTKAKLFSEVGKRTPIGARFSKGVGDKGDADSVIDPRGFAVKFYTEEGNWDLLGVNIPVFFFRDPMLLASFAHAAKRNPKTNVRDSNNLWDFFSLLPETLATVIALFSDRGLPGSYRHMDGFALNTFRLVNEVGQASWCRFTYLTDQGVRNITLEEATVLAGVDPDSFGRDLFDSIENGDFPSWTLYIQVMTLEQAQNCTFNPFDSTKEWPASDYPLLEAGKLVFNRNPRNFFADVEQMALCPANLVPGIEPSPDKILQGRLLSYPDTHRYRLGANFQQLPVNCPFRSRAWNYERDGPAAFTDNGGDSPNYYPNSFGGPEEDPAFTESEFDVCGVVARYDESDDDNFSQPRIYYTAMKDDEKQRLVKNIVSTLKMADKSVQERQLGNFGQVDTDLEKRLRKALKASKGKRGGY